jgi:three-Cys-motif partner protein
MMPPEYHEREQTFVKHIILRGYLQKVAYNILSAWDDFTFVDGFSGPWEARSEGFADTSFGIAIKELREVREAFRLRGSTKNLRCVFVEKEAEPFERLNGAAAGAADLHARAIHGTFEDNIPEVRRYVGSSFALTFVDPTGWSIDLNRIAPLLGQRGEVLINFMYEHFKRFVEDERPEIRASYEKPFGGLPWREMIDEEISRGLTKEEAILEVFKAAVKEVGGFEYVASARIRHRKLDKSHFYLVYGTRHPKGLEVFRQVERTALSAEEFFRIEARDREVSATGQGGLFESLPHNAEEIANAHWAEEVRQARSWSEQIIAREPVLAFEVLARRIQQRFSVVLPEVKDLLVDMKNEGLIEFDGLTGRQRKPRSGVMIRRTDKLEKGSVWDA